MRAAVIVPRVNYDELAGYVAIDQHAICSGKLGVTDPCNFNLTRLNEVDYSFTSAVPKIRG